MKLAILLLLLASALAAANNSTAANESNASQLFDGSAELSTFAHYLVPLNSSYEIYNFTVQNATLRAILVRGEPYAVVTGAFPLIGVQAATGQSDLEYYLYHFHLSKGKSPDAIRQLAIVHTGFETIAGKQVAGENKCRVLTGTDRHECNDFDSCQKSCYSVTSFCQPIALGAGRPFINTIWEFENNSRDLSLAYKAENESYSLLVKNSSKENAEGYLDAVSELNRAATKAYSNQLYYGYSYCFLPEYSLPVVTALQKLAQQSYQNASAFFTLPAQAELVRNRTLDGMLRQALSEEPEPEAVQNGTGQPNATAQNATLSANQTSQPLPTPPKEDNSYLYALGALLVGIAAGTAYHFLGKKRPPMKDYADVIQDAFTGEPQKEAKPQEPVKKPEKQEKPSSKKPAEGMLAELDSLDSSPPWVSGKKRK